MWVEQGVFGWTTQTVNPDLDSDQRPVFVGVSVCVEGVRGVTELQVLPQDPTGL